MRVTILRRLTLSLVALAFPLLCLSCGHVEIKDHEDFADAGDDGAFVFHELNDQTRWVDKVTWDEKSEGQDHRFGMICTSPENFTDKKAELETLCQNSQLCDYETKAAMERFFLRVQHAEEIIQDLVKRNGNGPQSSQ